MILVLGQYKRKGWSIILRETIVTATFLRPAVDAYRVSTNDEIDGLELNRLAEMMFNKASELSFESIPGCILQIFAWLLAPEKAGTFALLSIGVSSLTTGFTSAMIAFDMDIDVPHRASQPNFYGYIPSDNSLRGRCFVLMTLMSALHNLSRSLGCALLLLSDTDNLVLMFVGGELGIYLLLKILRQDFFYWNRSSGVFVPILTSFCERTMVKFIVDFCGCLHYRHPYELGGLGFTLSLVWSQVLPFVAVQFFDDHEGKEITKGAITSFLASCFILWLLLNIIFFCTIDLSYLNTFFGTMTAPQYTCKLFLTSEKDHQRFRAIFKNRREYTKTIHGEVMTWVAENITKWRRERPDWFKIEMIPDEFLPVEVIEAEGGADRRRSRVSLREIVGLREASVGRVHPQVGEEMKAEEEL